MLITLLLNYLTHFVLQLIFGPYPPQSAPLLGFRGFFPHFRVVSFYTFRFTPPNILDHAGNEMKRHYYAAMSAALLSILVGAVLCMSLLYLGAVTFYNDAGSVSEIYMSAANRWHSQIVNFCFGLGLYNLCLYGSFVISTINDVRLVDKPKYGLADVRAYLSAEEWGYYLKLLTILMIFHFVTFRSLASWCHYVPTYQATAAELGYNLLVWLDTIIAYVKVYLGLFLAVVFLIRLYHDEINMELLKKYKGSILASMVLMLCLNIIFDTARTYVSTCVVGLLDALTPTMAMRTISGFTRGGLFVVYMAYIYWIMAAALSLPIKMQSDREAEEAAYEGLEMIADAEQEGWAVEMTEGEV